MIRKAKYRAIPCYYDDVTEELTGRNWLFDQLVELNIWFDFEVLHLEDLPIWIETNNNEN